MAFMTKEWRGQEVFPVEGFHHVEFHVGNAKQAAYYYQKAFGFEPYAYAGPETGLKDEVRYVLRQNSIYLVLATGLRSTHPICQSVQRHGDAVHSIALQVPRPAEAFTIAMERGAKEAFAPRELKDEHGTIQLAGIRAYGDTIHTLIDTSGYRGIWAPGFVPMRPTARPARNAGLLAYDHIVANVPEGQMDRWAAFYERAFGLMTFVEFNEKDISTQYSALKSKVVRSANWRVRMPINEPAKGLRKSQIDEFIDYYEGSGVQHIALETADIIHTISVLRENGVEFLAVPPSYYESLEERVGRVSEDLDQIRKLNILVDRDQEGYLLQLFTKPVEDRPTFFFEIIQRRGALGFGQGNFQALFEAIEREQARRGNL